MPTFNLIEQAWLPCVTLEGERTELSLREPLVNSHSVRELFDESPLVTVALHRLLLAILHRNFGPNTLQSWAQLWNAGHWDAQKLIEYFAGHHERFDLFDTERPFYQMAVMQEAADQPAAILLQELARGNNATLFDHSFETYPAALPASRAARALVAVQAFSIGFGKSKPFYLSDSPLIRGLTIVASGDNLFQTLALNLLPYTEDRPIPSGPQDAPAWEQNRPAKPRREGTVPLGYLDYLTWQSRRIHLYPERNPIVISRCQLQQNLKLTEGILDPFKCFVKTKEAGFRPLRLRSDKALWRDSHALFQQADESSKRPELFNHLARVEALRAAGKIGARRTYGFSAFGLATEEGKAASITMWRHERLPLPLQYLNNKPLLDRLKDALEVCEALATDLKMSARELARYLLAPNCDQAGARSPNPKEVTSLVDSFAIEGRYWPELEGPFKKLLVDLLDDTSTDRDGDVLFGTQEIPRWRQTVRLAARNAFEETIRDLDTTGRSLKADARARAVSLGGWAGQSLWAGRRLTMSRVSPRDRQFAEWLEKLREDPRRAQGAMAALKRALGKAAGQVPTADRYVLPWLPAGPSRREEDDEKAYYLVASLFASHQKSWTAAEEHRGPTNFGASMRLLGETLKKEGPERRFVAILNSDSSDLHEHLRHAVSYLKSQSIGIDWAQLLADIRGWQYDDRRVQREWARAFWGESAQPLGQTSNDEEGATEPEREP